MKFEEANSKMELLIEEYPNKSIIYSHILFLMLFIFSQFMTCIS